MIDLLLAAVPAAGGLGSPADMWAAIVHDFANITEPAAFAAFLQVLMIDLVLAGDNAIVVGALAAGLPPDQRRKVIMLGVLAALVLRIAFALIVTQLLQVIGLILIGGLLLLWVAYNLFKEIHPSQPVILDDPDTAEVEGPPQTKTFLQAAVQIAIADLSMSLDNVLLVASIAKDNPALLVIGLSFSVLFMGFAANYVARLIQRYHWINYVGLAVILYVAGNMIYEGWVGGEHVLGLRNAISPA